MGRAADMGLLPVPPPAVPVGAARVVAEIVWPKLRLLPAQCLAGTLSIPLRDVQPLCVGRDYRAVMAWLDAANILRVTVPFDRERRRTSLYWANARLLIWLAGLSDAELVWELHKGGKNREAAL